MKNPGLAMFLSKLAAGRKRPLPPFAGPPPMPQPAMPPPPDGQPPQGFAKGVLSAKQRQALPRSSFALPGQGKGPKGAGSGSYPIPDKKHGRLALSMVSRYGSPAEKAKVRAKVHAKYPEIGKK